MGPVRCGAGLPAGADEIQSDDLYLANDRFRVVMRNPAQALSLSGLSGGTLIAGAPWGGEDALYELAPMVGGGWLVVDDWSYTEDTVELSGRVKALPGREAVGVGERHTVRWRIPAEGPWLSLEGADGVWIHPSPGSERVDQWLLQPTTVLGHDGQITEDLGGALLVEGVTELMFDGPQTAWSHGEAPARSLQGSAPEATTVELWSDGTLVGKLPVSQGSFEAEVSPTITHLRAISLTNDPSPLTELPEEETPLTLELGGSSLVTFTPVWPESLTPRPIQAEWTDTTGRARFQLLEPTGDTIILGTGAHVITLSGGPYIEPVEVSLITQNAQTARLGVDLTAASQPTSHVLATFHWPAARSTSIRRTSVSQLRRAIGAGLSFAVTTAGDDVPAPQQFGNDLPWLRVQAGVDHLQSPAPLTSWSWSPDFSVAGHGIPQLNAPTADDVFGLTGGRRTVAALQWWQDSSLVPTDRSSLRPAFMELPSPGFPPFSAWDTWFQWLDAYQTVWPAGPLLWLEMADPTTLTDLAINTALNKGMITATTGPFLDLRVDQMGPGSVLEEPSAPLHTLDLDLSSAPGDISAVSIWSEGIGTIFSQSVDASGRLDWTGEAALGAWTIAIAWSTSGEHWAVTAPIWTEQPFTSTDTATETDTAQPAEAL